MGLDGWVIPQGILYPATLFTSEGSAYRWLDGTTAVHRLNLSSSPSGRCGAPDRATGGRWGAGTAGPPGHFFQTFPFKRGVNAEDNAF